MAPIARAMPISDRRSAASIEKMSTISSTPTAIEKSPMTMKIEVNALASNSAMSVKSSFIFTTPSDWPSSDGVNAS